MYAISEGEANLSKSTLFSKEWVNCYESLNRMDLDGQSTGSLKQKEDKFYQIPNYTPPLFMSYLSTSLKTLLQRKGESMN